MNELKPGEYVGADGLVHRAHLHHSVEQCVWTWGPGPEGKRCKTCSHLDGHPGAGRIYWKCLLRAYSHGPGTDHRVNWPACGKWEEVADA